MQSHPSRVRGLKSCSSSSLKAYSIVASFTGAWIEISILTSVTLGLDVASFTGAWIEIHICIIFCEVDRVASFTGAWIEILSKLLDLDYL